MIKGLIYDFDGLIIDTEICDYHSWLEIYQEYDLDYPLCEWQKIIGNYSAIPVPLDRLDRLAGPIDRNAIDKRRMARSTELALKQDLLPGVMDYLENMRLLGLKAAIASSSPRTWLDCILKPRNLARHFQTIVTGDMVNQVKPSPELFNAALKILGITPAEALVLEDSVNGLIAAKSAGIRCVIIPSSLTRGMDFHDADLVLDSLDSMPLTTLIEHFNGDAPDA
ncbi:MAG: HAD-IA family hydrolase [Anaerolineaceae bacterium]|nr:HAD-IA family hydrolase [Anaerolineaceae bacterium]MBN2678542.1 HAD-IA family hydrolase [Anaerolineaceae bacterium]